MPNPMAAARIGLIQASAEIAYASRYRKAQGGPPPFFYVVGAGVSAPFVPLSGAIVDQCARKIDEMGLVLPGANGSPAALYNAYLEAAYPQPEERQEFLKSLLLGKPLSPASLYLARLLGDGTISRLAITPNLEDQLPRSLQSRGHHQFILCDHPKTSHRIRPSAAEIQLGYVHGTCLAYDCNNLEHEISRQAIAHAPDGSSFRQLLDAILRERSPIVIGYAGWKEDVIMASFLDHLDPQSRHRHKWYWFCYTDADAESLPEELTRHPEVRLVVPNPPPSLYYVSSNSPYWSGTDRLPAETVLRRLVDQLEISQLQGISEMRRAVEEGEHRRAIRIAEDINLKALTLDERETSDALLRKAFYRIRDSEPDEGLFACSLRQRLTEGVLGEFPAEPSWRKRLTSTLYDRGYCLHRLHRFEKAASVFKNAREGFESFFGTPSSGDEKSIAYVRMLLSEGAALGEIGDWDKSIELSRRAIAKALVFLVTDTTRRWRKLFRKNLRRARYNLGLAQLKAGRYEEALSSFETLVIQSRQEGYEGEFLRLALVAESRILHKIGLYESLQDFTSHLIKHWDGAEVLRLLEHLRDIRYQEIAVSVLLPKPIGYSILSRTQEQDRNAHAYTQQRGSVYTRSPIRHGNRNLADSAVRFKQMTNSSALHSAIKPRRSGGNALLSGQKNRRREENLARYTVLRDIVVAA